MTTLMDTEDNVDHQIICRCKVCGKQFLYQGKGDVTSLSLSEQLKTIGVEQNGCLFWVNGDVTPVPGIDSPSAFSQHELGHKFEQLGAVVTITSFTCGKGYVTINDYPEQFWFGDGVTIVDALANALVYLITQ